MIVRPSMVSDVGSRAVARFFVKGSRALVGGSGGLLPHKIFKFGGSKTLFSALVMSYVSEKSTPNKCEKAGVFSAYNIISDFPAMKMANKCKSQQSKQLSLKKTNPLNNENPQSTDLICLAQLVQGGQLPPLPPPPLQPRTKLLETN